MGSSDKFWLRWNDFELNTSLSFRELRKNNQYFDVSLVVEDHHVVKAHRVILAACSPFFRNILSKLNVPDPYGGTSHPVIYLKGIKNRELRHILDFMYHGEVRVAQNELNAFLAVAEELRMKGLTDDKMAPSSFPSNPRPKKVAVKRSKTPKKEENGISAKKKAPDGAEGADPKSDQATDNPDELVENVTPVKQEIKCEVQFESDDEDDATETTEDTGNTGEGSTGGGTSIVGGRYDGQELEVYPPNVEPSTSEGFEGPINPDIDCNMEKIDSGVLCLICTTRFTQRRSFVRHFKETHLEKGPFPCPEPDCDVVLPRRRTLQRHIKNKHPFFKLDEPI